VAVKEFHERWLNEFRHGKQNWFFFKDAMTHRWVYTLLTNDQHFAMIDYLAKERW